MKTISLASILCFTTISACGEIHPGDSLGKPIYTLRANLRGHAIEKAQGEYRAIFAWWSWGGGDAIECLHLHADDPEQCRTANEVELMLRGVEVPVKPEFPAAFEIDFRSPPQELLRFKDSVFAMGGLAIYDDRNRNGQLDPLNSGEEESVDRLVAESTVTAFQTAVLYREGPVHPVLKLLMDDLGCPEPPMGFSVGGVYPDQGCVINREDTLLVTSSQPWAIARARCGGNIAQFNFGLEPYPPEALPPNAVTRCGDENDIFVWIDNGRYCDRFQERRYALKNTTHDPMTTWDFTQMPPVWWPCPVRE